MRGDYYTPCTRCGEIVKEHGRTLKSSGRLLCDGCIRALPYDGHGHKVDDLATPKPHDETTGYPHVDKSVHKMV